MQDRQRWFARRTGGEMVYDAPGRAELVAHPARGVARVNEQVTYYRRNPLLTLGQEHRAPTPWWYG
ncbi:hypothetical protein Pa4123_26070 [Phytohabitans aurantiacus]|uniref:Uncharacterized protein n=1 Tax=Phytohabitans aurantiacus TaxID=3016789 RepID=A0ABQ5QTY2_9ACTN|nr:hypothetical protein Pa4123_26070 [Phytohabitans aurantiacus]